MQALGTPRRFAAGPRDPVGRQVAGLSRAERLPGSTSPRNLAVVRTRRAVVDHALQRRAVLASLRGGRTSAVEICDATPYLIRAAKFHGRQGTETCPVCRREPVWLVNYVYGDELKTLAGQAKSDAELTPMAMTFQAFRVYVIEVCRGCGWNHLTESYTLGRDGLAEANSQRRAARD